MDYVRKRIKDIFSSTSEDGVKWSGSLDNLDYYSLICRAASNNVLFNLDKNNVCMFKYSYDDKDAILMLFSVPINLENENKHITERVMEIIQILEENFITLDYLETKELKEEKFQYITAVKILDEN